MQHSARAGERRSAGPSAASAACSTGAAGPIDHLALVPGATAPSRLGRAVVGGELIRLEIGTVSREREETDLLGVTVHPVSDLCGPVHGVFVRDEEAGPTGVPEQPPREREEHRCREPLGDELFLRGGFIATTLEAGSRGGASLLPCNTVRRPPAGTSSRLARGFAPMRQRRSLAVGWSQGGPASRITG